MEIANVICHIFAFPSACSLYDESEWPIRALAVKTGSRLNHSGIALAVQGLVDGQSRRKHPD